MDKDGYEYEYDYENRIVKITKDGNDVAGFAYDALGRRIEKKDLGGNAFWAEGSAATNSFCGDLAFVQSRPEPVTCLK